MKDERNAECGLRNFAEGRTVPSHRWGRLGLSVSYRQVTLRLKPDGNELH